MGKTDDLRQLVNLLTKALRHKIGSLVNANEFYVSKYAKDAEIILKEAEKVLLKRHWNLNDKQEIKTHLKKQLKEELTEKTFLDNKKFEMMDEELGKVLKQLSLV